MERIPTWVIDDRSGATEGEPSPWVCEDDGQGQHWSRTGLIAFGRANALYRRRHFTCPDCESMLRPLRRRAFFACIGCLVAFRWRDGTLDGHGRGSEGAVSVSPTEFRFR